MRVNTNLKKAREKSSLTQVQIAQKVGISETSYQRIEYGSQRPSLRTALLIAQALSTTVEEIFPVSNLQD